jgi:hypothetical protein
VGGGEARERRRGGRAGEYWEREETCDTPSVRSERSEALDQKEVEWEMVERAEDAEDGLVTAPPSSLARCASHTARVSSPWYRLLERSVSSLRKFTVSLPSKHAPSKHAPTCPASSSCVALPRSRSSLNFSGFAGAVSPLDL